ncbi:MAG: hypothetical protein WCT51_04475 [Candidatus Shapirobacteria bacterium]|jgi:hypothetical protein
MENKESKLLVICNFNEVIYMGEGNAYNWKSKVKDFSEEEIKLNDYYMYEIIFNESDDSKHKLIHIKSYNLSPPIYSGDTYSLNELPEAWIPDNEKFKEGFITFLKNNKEK